MTSIVQPLRVRSFRRLWLASAVSLFGDHITFVALPWLVLKLTNDALAMGTVFAIDALTFVVGLSLLLLVRERFTPDMPVHDSILSSVVEGLQWVCRDVPLRMFMLMMAAFSLVFRGPFMVGVPALANAHLDEGAAAFGTIMSALGVGSIIGAVLAGSASRQGTTG